MKHTIAALVDNKPGVLARISGLFSARGFNIDSLAVGETNDPTVSRMTIIVDAKDERILEQIKKQLHKLIDIITVLDLTEKEFFERELVLIKVNGQNTDNLQSAIEKFSAKVLSADEKTTIIEAVGSRAEISELLNGLKDIGISELVRTGRIAIAK
ncbi:MAG: acetolactate synthase small subunit [Candidatus Omnitrophota bacterium]|nr:MAG: acetolactate synthase small subunit [Candidatus Omnitrophota bacterium]